MAIKILLSSILIIQLSVIMCQLSIKLRLPNSFWQAASIKFVQ